MNREPKPVEERDALDLLELVCQLHSRALSQPRNKNMHDAYVGARQEMERRIKVNNNFVLADSINRLSDEQIDSIIYNLDEYARDYDGYEYGLPTHGEHIQNMRILVKQLLNDR